MKKLSFSIFKYVIIGILLILIVSFVEVSLEAHTFNWGILGHTLFTLIKEIGIALIIVGSITIAIELGDFTEFILKRLTDIMINDKFIDNLDDNKKGELIDKLEEQLYFQDQIRDPNSFFYTVRDQVSPLLEECYYNEYSVQVECTIEGNFIKKTIRRRIEVKNPNRSKCLIYPLEFNTSMKQQSGIDSSQLYQIKSVHINSEDKTEEVNSTISYSKADDYPYDLLVYGKYDVEVHEVCIIEVEVKTVVPLTDKIYMHRINKPCKEYRMQFLLYDDGYELAGHAFGFMDREKAIRQKLDRGLLLRLSGWTLPGDGFIFFMNKKGSV